MGSALLNAPAAPTTRTFGAGGRPVAQPMPPHKRRVLASLAPMSWVALDCAIIGLATTVASQVLLLGVGGTPGCPTAGSWVAPSAPAR